MAPKLDSKVKLPVKLDRVEKVVIVGLGVAFALAGLAGLWALLD